MTEQTPDPTPDTSSDAAKDPADWVTGDEPITGPQGSYLHTLAREAGEEVPADLTKAQASEMIDRLQGKTGRGARPPAISGAAPPPRARGRASAPRARDR